MSLLVIFMLLYNEFKDVKESGVILLNLPLALIGGVIILWLTSGEISIPRLSVSFLVWYRYPKRYAADQPLYAFAWRGNGIA